MRKNGGNVGKVKPCQTGPGSSSALAVVGCPAIGTYRCIYNYTADAGAGSHAITGLAGGAGWRAVLLGTVAAGALLLSTPRSARAGPDDCTHAAPTATCQGDQSAGISSSATFPATGDFPDTYTTLNVNALTTDIAPASGIDGIYFHGTTSVDITSDTGPYSIIVNGAGADGIDARTPYGGAVTITSTGDITSTDGNGISALSANSGNAGVVTINSEGDVTAGDGFGIAADSLSDFGNSDAVSVTSTGDVSSTRNAIHARSEAEGGESAGAVTVVTRGDLTASGAGALLAGSLGQTGAAAVTVDSVGRISSQSGFAIEAVSSTSSGDAGTVTVTSRGDISAGPALAAIDAISQSYSGNSDTVTVLSEGNIHADAAASGAPAVGIYARSFTNFGNAGAVSVTSTGDISDARIGVIAYSRSLYGNAEAVSVNSSGNISAIDRGILARNFGSGGASAISVVSRGDIAATSQGKGFGIQVNSFAPYGQAGAVTVTSTGDITASGGDAGAGIIASSGSLSDNSGNVAVTSEGNIRTAAIYTYGILATTTTNYGPPSTGNAGAISVESVGDITATSLTSYSYGAAIGISARSRASGGNSGNMVIDSTGDIFASATNTSSAYGSRAYGIRANTESDTGTSGEVLVTNVGAVTAKTVSLGTGPRSETLAFGLQATSTATSGAAGAVHVENHGDVRSTAYGGGPSVKAYGIYALSQSNASNSGAVTISSTGDISAIGTVGRGIQARSQSRNGAAGEVKIESTGDITASTTAIYARSYGAAGAAGITLNSIGNITSANGNGIDAEVGTVTGNTGDLSVTSRGNIAALGGIFASNFSTYGNAGSIDVSSIGNISSKIAAYSGSNHGSAGTVTVTSTGDSAGISARVDTQYANAGAVTVTNTGDVNANGGGNAAIFAESSASFSGSSGPVLVTNVGNITVPTGVDLYGMRVDSLGADGSGSVEIVSVGNISTSSRAGLLVQSDTRFGSSGDAVITSTGNISSYGRGIVAASDSGYGQSGDVVITSKGNISTVGSGSPGIFALNFAGGVSAGSVTITTTGDITAGGTDSDAIYARDQGFSGASNGNIAVTVLEGSLTGGSRNGVGVRFVGGVANTLTNFGSIAALSGTAIDAKFGGNDRIENYGIITGNVNLGSGANVFDNHTGALFNSGAVAFIGSGSLLTNDGTLSPGGSNTILTTSLTGNFRQTGVGQFLVDLQGANADRVNAIGSATVAGNVKPNYTLESLGSSTQWTILTAISPIVDNGIKAVSTPVVQFAVIFPTATQMDLKLLGVDFVVNGLNRNETAIAENFNDVFATGNLKGLNTVMNAIATLPSNGSVANALDQLSPEVYLDTEIASLFSNLAFTNSMMTCPERDGAYAFIREGQCVWARVSGRFYDQDTTFQTLGFNETNFQVSGGGQMALGGAWRLGGALGYEHSELETSTNAQSDGDRFNGGGVLTYNPGALLLSAAVSGGTGSYDIDRPITFPGFSALAKGDTDIDNIDGRFRAAYLFDFGGWYLKPLVDLDATKLDLDGTNERGAGGASLVVKGNNQTYLSASPALELGTRYAMANGTLIRPYVRGGVTIFDETDFTLKASFAGTPKGVSPFLIRTGIDDVVADVSAGVEILDLRGTSLKLFYDGRFGDTMQENAAGAKATVPF